MLLECIAEKDESAEQFDTKFVASGVHLRYM